MLRNAVTGSRWQQRNVDEQINKRATNGDDDDDEDSTRRSLRLRLITPPPPPPPPPPLLLVAVVVLVRGCDWMRMLSDALLASSGRVPAVAAAGRRTVLHGPSNN